MNLRSHQLPLNWKTVAIALILIILLLSMLRPKVAAAQPFTEFALTASSANYAADLPAWSPLGETIVYTRYWNSGPSIYYRNHIYAVQGNATGIAEVQLAAVPVGSGDLPNTISWRGSTPIIGEDLGLNSEYFSFLIPSTPPFTRTAFDGSDSRFTLKLKGDWANVPSWGISTEDAGFIRVSRDGSTALVRWSSVINTTGYTKLTKIYTGPFSSMSGQFISKSATTTDWEDQPGVVQHLTATQHYLNKPYTLGASLTPNGGQFIISDGVNLWKYNSDGSNPPTSAFVVGIPFTNPDNPYLGYFYPDISPDGTKFLYSKRVSSGKSGLFMRNIDGTGEQEIVAAVGLQVSWPTFAPDGRRAAYVKNGRIYRVSGLKGFRDCNNNDIADLCDIPYTDQTGFCPAHCVTPGLCQTQSDCNTNFIPDNCELDSDGDGAIDSCDACPTDPNKTLNPGSCGCGIPELDNDNDGAMNCIDLCPDDPLKITSSGLCGCGVAEVDTDNDGTVDCVDLCPADLNKVAPGACGCGISDIDTDGDTTADCNDLCPTDSTKVTPGSCGCGLSDLDSDGDTTLDCLESCPSDPSKTTPGGCGCGVADKDNNKNGILDCLTTAEYKFDLSTLTKLLPKVAPVKLTGKPKIDKARKTKLQQLVREIKALLTRLERSKLTPSINATMTKNGKLVRKALNTTSKTFAKDKRTALAALKKMLGSM